MGEVKDGDRAIGEGRKFGIGLWGRLRTGIGLQWGEE